MKNLSLRTVLLGALLVLTGCASIVNGPRQSIGIASIPTNASVWVDRIYMGRTPVIVNMTRKHNHIVRIEIDGYQPYEATFTRKMNGWVFGNIVFGGIIGMAIDACTGAMYKLTPENIQADMKRNDIAFSRRTTDSYIAVVMKPDPSWEKIGNLTIAE